VAEKTPKCRLQMDKRLLRCVFGDFVRPRVRLGFDGVELFFQLEGVRFLPSGIEFLPCLQSPVPAEPRYTTGSHKIGLLFAIWCKPDLMGQRNGRHLMTHSEPWPLPAVCDSYQASSHTFGTKYDFQHILARSSSNKTSSPLVEDHCLLISSLKKGKIQLRSNPIRRFLYVFTTLSTWGVRNFSHKTSFECLLSAG